MNRKKFHAVPVRKEEGETQWFFCTNCCCEFSLEELGLFISPENGGLKHFCPHCGWTEFVRSDEYEFPPEAEKTMEDGPDTCYPYPDPKHLVKKAAPYHQKNHAQMMEEQEDKSGKELKHVSEELKKVFTAEGAPQ
jgi:hypothetical protein